MNKKTLKEIKRIQSCIPKELHDQLFYEDYIAPDYRLAVLETLKEMWKEADDEEAKGNVKDAEIIRKEAQRLQNVVETGAFDAKELKINHEAAKQIDEWMDKELETAIKEKRITHPKNDRDYQSFKRKLKQNESRESVKIKRERVSKPVVGGDEAKAGESVGSS